MKQFDLPSILSKASHVAPVITIGLSTKEGLNYILGIDIGLSTLNLGKFGSNLDI